MQEIVALVPIGRTWVGRCTQCGRVCIPPRTHRGRVLTSEEREERAFQGWHGGYSSTKDRADMWSVLVVHARRHGGVPVVEVRDHATWEELEAEHKAARTVTVGVLIPADEDGPPRCGIRCTECGVVRLPPMTSRGRKLSDEERDELARVSGPGRHGWMHGTTDRADAMRIAQVHAETHGVAAVEIERGSVAEDDLQRRTRSRY